MTIPIFTPPRDLLSELEPVAERLLNRHLGMAKEWFPHDYVPYSLGRDYDKEPWTRTSRASAAWRRSPSRSTS